MSNITLCIKEKGMSNYLSKNDKRDDYGNEDNFWLDLDQYIEECYFDKNGSLILTFNYDESSGEPYIYIEIPLAELIEQFEKFDVVEDMTSYIFKSSKTIAKLSELMNKIKEKRQLETERRIAEYKKKDKEEKAKK